MTTTLCDNLDNEWASFLNTSATATAASTPAHAHAVQPGAKRAAATAAPPSTDIYISTQTKIVYLNQPVDLKSVFWNIPVMSFDEQKEGVLKKQMKFNSLTPEELADIQDHLKDEPYYEEYILTSINNPEGRIKFKDIRKVSVGRRSKDMAPHRGKQKSAFYNCFVLIFRMETPIETPTAVNLSSQPTILKEYHVKVFNTGKLEIPGIQQSCMLPLLVERVVATMRPWVGETLAAQAGADGHGIRSETVLINSNFHCGFTLHRERLYDILKTEYRIPTIYDPCSYPGIQCKLTYRRTDEGRPVAVTPGTEEEEKDSQNHHKLSFMIFRTGSVLIVGKCDEDALRMTYETLKEMLTREYPRIVVENVSDEDMRDKFTPSTKKK
jgi:hypothetical protein